MLRFVIQKHVLNDGTIHFDIMFEKDGVLKTYQISNIEDLLNFQSVDAKNIQDHRIIYLDYEGEISNNRGYVKIFDTGEYVIKEMSNGSMKFEVKGKIISGIMSFLLTDSKTKMWRLSYEKNQDIFI